MELNLAFMDLAVMEYMMRQQVEKKERTALIPNPKLVAGLGGKHVHAPIVKTVRGGALEILAKRNSTFVISKDVAKYMAKPHISVHTCAGIQGRGHSCVIGHTVGSALHVRMSFRDINVHIQERRNLPALSALSVS